MVGLEGVGDRVVAYTFAAEGGEESTAAKGEAEVACQRADISAFAAVDTEVELWKVRGNFA